jgi:transcription antitermination protein NusB
VVGGSRREARERALSLLYEAEAKGVTTGEVLADLPLPPDPYVVTLVDGIAAQSDEIDGLLRRYLKMGWPLERLASLDRSVLRMATWELLQGEPPGVAISEAVELVKRFSTEDSSRFVNGVLSAISRDQAPK